MCYMFGLWWTKAIFEADESLDLPWYMNQSLLLVVLLLLAVAHEILGNMLFVSQVTHCIALSPILEWNLLITWRVLHFSSYFLLEFPTLRLVALI